VLLEWLWVLLVVARNIARPIEIWPHFSFSEVRGDKKSSLGWFAHKQRVSLEADYFI